MPDERVEAEAGRILDGALEEVVTALTQRSATRLVVDLTNNGGGDDWVEAVALLLAGEMPSAWVALLKHAASRESLSNTSAALSRASGDASPTQRPAIESALGRVVRAAAALDERCDQRGAWSHEAGRPWPSCTRLVDGALFASGAFDVDPYLV